MLYGPRLLIIGTLLLMLYALVKYLWDNRRYK